MVIGLVVWGLFSLRNMPIDAVPDITNNQVQVITTSPTLATQEVEQFITTPIELSLQNIQQVEEMRSISRFGLSVVTVVFEESMDIYLARQLVSEHLRSISEAIPPTLGTPELAPISTGLGEIYQYVIHAQPGYEDEYSIADLREIQDWIVRRQLSGIKGVVEVNTTGGILKQYEVAVDPSHLKSMQIDLIDVYDALEASNENTGGAYIEKRPNTYFIRTEGLIQSLDDIRKIVVRVHDGTPITIGDVAEVRFGEAPRYGALTRNGEEAVGGIVMLLKGANSAEVTELIKQRVEQVQHSLPEGVVIVPYLVRDKLINTAISTVKKNLIEGGLIVIFILVIFLGNWRAGLIVASVIPLSMLFALSMMRLLGISANLMSLGAIDFGLIVDGAVIIVEAILHRLHVNYAGRRLSSDEMDQAVLSESLHMRKSAAFGEIIILMVYIPILALVGIEGKMFKPMAETVMLAIAGALILSLTYVPMISAWFLNKKITQKTTFSDRVIRFFHSWYEPVLLWSLRHKMLCVSITILLFIMSVVVFNKMGGEFIPTLEEGDLALHQVLPPGSSLSQSIEASKMIQHRLLEEFPEVVEVVTRIGSQEIPTDPMPIETGDVMVIMKPKNEWTSATTRQDMQAKMLESLEVIPGIGYEATQPIQMRFNELMTGSRADIAIKLFGDDLDILYEKAKDVEKLLHQIDGIASINVEQITGMPQIMIRYRFDRLAQYGLHVKDVNRIIRAAYAGGIAGTVYEKDRRFDLVVRLTSANRASPGDLHQLYVTMANGTQIPLSEVADIEIVDAPMQISRDNGYRRIVIGVNVGNIDVETLVARIKTVLNDGIKLPPGYYFSFGGQFENLVAAKSRLLIAVPIALGLIFILLYLTFHSISQALLIFTAIPLSAIGGVWALLWRDMPFSISAGIGFIALFGVAVLNGIVLIASFNQLKQEGMKDIYERVKKGTHTRLRPVLMTAAVASFGFLPMALSTSGGAEVQRPLATVVIGGLISATILTLIILPILYTWLASYDEKSKQAKPRNLAWVWVLIMMSVGVTTPSAQYIEVSRDQAIQIAMKNHPAIDSSNQLIRRGEVLLHQPYQLGRTEFSIQGDALYQPNGQRVRQFSLSQEIPFNSGVKALNYLNDIRMSQYQLKQELTKVELSSEVEKDFIELQYYQNVKLTLDSAIHALTQYARMAEQRYQLGETGQLEWLRIKSQHDYYENKRDESRIIYDGLLTRFNILLNADEWYVPTGELTVDSIDQIVYEDNLRLKLVEHQISLEQSKVQYMKASKRPSLQVGYALQDYDDGGWLHGVQAGITMSIFNEPLNQRIEAQKINVDIARNQYDALSIELNRQLQRNVNQMNMHRQSANWYQHQLETVNSSIIENIRLNYQAGNIPYYEMIEAINQWIEFSLAKWSHIREYQLAKIEYTLLNIQ